jgi:DNA polymerase-1
MTNQNLNQKQLFLIDGTALAYRSYFAFVRNPLINSKGVNTSGVFGFTTSLMKILREEKPDYIACVFDTAAPTFRHKAFPEYKATREKMPDELADQLPVIRSIVESFKIPVIEIEGYEADDVMGTLAKQAEDKGIDTYLVTGDKDFMQLLSDRIKIYNLKRSGNSSEAEVIDSGKVIEKMGVSPERVIDLLGLMGDSSDNVPGIPGIGPKRAQELLKSYGSLENVLDMADQVNKKNISNNLKTFRQQALLSKKLVTICIDVPLEVSISDLSVTEPERDKLISQFQELEFNRLIRDLAEFLGEDREEHVRNYHIIATVTELEVFIKQLKDKSMFVIDLETTSLDPVTAEIVGFSFSWNEGEAFYIPVTVPEEEKTDDLFAQPGNDVQEVLAKLRPILEDAQIHKCGQNIKYDMLVLRHHGIELRGIDFDTMVAAYLVNPSARQFGIDALALEYLNLKKIATKDLIGSGKKQIRMDQVEIEKVAEYACEDADVALRLRHLLEPKLKKNKTDRLFKEVEIPLIMVLMEMEDNGVALDKALLSKMSTKMESQLNLLQNEIYEIAGENFNINSTQQLGIILFEKLKVHELLGKRRPKKTKTGGYSTDVRVLESLSVHLFPQKILEYRQLAKLKSTYVDSLPRLINRKTGRVHASFNQTVAATGRLSSSNPNLQNIPIRTELGKEIRRAFIPENQGWMILSADYSQIELRIMAHLSGDETLLESFKKNEDVHSRTASEIFEISVNDVTSEHRRQAKTINFGIIYGMGVFGLAQRLGISQEEAQSFISAYFARYPKVNDFIVKTISQAYKQGFVTTLLNRRRYLPELESENRNIRDFGERTAVNTPIQGTAADLIKVAMIRIAEHLRSDKWKTKMILQIHDELVFEGPSEELGSLTDMVRQEMEGAIELSVPVKVDIGVGNNWLEAH